MRGLSSLFVASTGIGSQTKLIHPAADTCLLPGCGRVRYRDQDGTVHDYCGKIHANQAKKSCKFI